MTQAPATTPSGSATPSRPTGFAAPRVAPLSDAIVAPPTTPAPQQAPEDFAAPTQPAVPLARIAPAPPETRDPTQPYVATVPAPAQPDWRPDQPLTTSRPLLDQPDPEPGPEVDPATLPPPDPHAVAGLPAPRPVSPYPVNPYASGPYSRQPYPGPAGWQGRPPQPPTLQGLVRLTNPAVLTLLGIAVLWAQVSPFAVLGAAVVGFVAKVPGRPWLGSTAVSVSLISIPWYFGYIGNGQWHATSQLLALLCLAGVLLSGFMALRRRS